MKKSRLLFAVLAFVLVVALVACGGEKQPEVTEDPSTAATTTTAKADAATTTKAPAATTTAAPVVTTTAAPVVESKRPNTLDEYKSLFVSAGNVVHLNFADATVDSPDIIGSSKYEDETALATDRFYGEASNYTDYLFNSIVENPVSGGTAKILSPWKFKNNFAEGHWIFEGGTSTTGGGKSNADYVSEYRETEVSGVTDYYISNGEWSKCTYASQWGEGYLNLGLWSTLSFAKAIETALLEDPSYTVQLVFQRNGKGTIEAFLGQRVLISGTQGSVTFKRNSTYGYPTFESATKEIETFDINAINGYTFSYNRADLKAVVIDMYANTDLVTSQTCEEGKLDNIFKVFEREDSNVYAIRVYDRPLTEAEVIQNHFADLALYLGLDITEVLALDDTARAKVYEAMKTFTYDYPALLVQPILNQAVAAAK
jgi:hypothetical protein